MWCEDGDDEMSDLINLADGLIASPGKLRDLFIKKKTSQEWIPVSERLPETNEKVLITRRFGLYVGDDYDRCIDLGYYYSNLNRWDTLNLDDIEVLAWMPLPEPYKEVTK